MCNILKILLIILAVIISVYKLVPMKNIMKTSYKIKPIKKLEDVTPTLIDYLATKRVVMLGEASHGTEEYYYIRRLITEKLVQDHGFNIIAVEGDWPECFNINKYIQSDTIPSTTIGVLKHFKRWPTWMWSNTQISQMMENLHKINKTKNKKDRCGFYGLDVYSLFESIDVVIREIGKIDPELANLAKYRYACFEKFRHNENDYVRYLLKVPEGCREGAIKMLVDILKIRIDSIPEDDEIMFNIKQNAKIILNAENYYRTMISADDKSWNIRDRHMAETLESILKVQENSKAIVWAHNTHIGDYRYTDMIDQGEVNIGGLGRDMFKDVALVGFGTYKGSVIASNKWGGKIKKLPVPPGQIGSWDAYFHNICEQLNSKGCVVNFTELNSEEQKEFLARKGQRAIGVVYHPAYEFGNYVPTVLGRRYDAFIFIDETNAVDHIDVTAPDRKEIPHDYPFNA